MTAVSFVFSIVTAFLITAYFLHNYANWRKQQVVVIAATFIAWLFSFSMILVLPIDISSTYYRQCLKDHNITNLPGTEAVADTDVDGDTDGECNEPFSYVPNIVLRTFWSVTYWTSQALTWLIFPVMQNYSACGEFSALKRLRSTILAHILQNATYILLFCIILIYVLTRTEVHLNSAQLKAIVISAANTWGLVFVVLFLGFGLVELPRRLFVESDLQRILRRTYFKISKLNVEKAEAEEDFRAVCDELSHLVAHVSESNRNYRYVDQLRQSFCSSPSTSRSGSKAASNGTAASRNPSETTLTERQLVSLHARLIRARNLASRLHAQFTEALSKAVRLETIQTNLTSRNHDFKESEVCLAGLIDESAALGKTSSNSPEKQRGSLNSGDENVRVEETNCGDPLESPLLPTAVRARFAALRRRVRWYFRCVWRFQLLKCAAVLFAAVSVLVVFSECTFFIQKPVLSVFALLLDAASHVHVHGLYFLAQLVSLATLAYMSSCIYYTVFKLRIFNYFQLVGSQQSDERSLIFSAGLLCRLTPPLCLNFLGLIHRDSHVTSAVHNLEETHFTQIMGHINLIKVISNGVNLYFPLLILVLCAFTYFRLYARCLNYFGFQQFLDADGDYDVMPTGSLPAHTDDLTHEMVDEGRDLVRRACRQSARVCSGTHIQSDNQNRSPRSREPASLGNANEAFELDVRRSSLTKPNERRESGRNNLPRLTRSSSSSSNRFGVTFAEPAYVRVPLHSESDDSVDEPRRIDDDDLDRALEERAAKRGVGDLNSTRQLRPSTVAALANPSTSSNIFEDV